MKKRYELKMIRKLEKRAEIIGGIDIDEHKIIDFELLQDFWNMAGQLYLLKDTKIFIKKVGNSYYRFQVKDEETWEKQKEEDVHKRLETLEKEFLEFKERVIENLNQLYKNVDTILNSMNNGANQGNPAG